jgi:predicted enzyme related to lactoylglutathione lyase
MTSPSAPSQTFHGAFHYVFYTPADHYGVTVAFYRDVLQLPVQSGWDDPATSSYGTLFLASSTGIIEVMTESDTSPFRATLLQPEEEYRPPRGGFMLFEVPDVDMAYQHAKEQGAEIVQELHNWPWGFRDFKVKDPCGNIVSPFSRLGEAG